MLTSPDTNEDQKVFGSALLFVASGMIHQRRDCCEHGFGHMYDRYRWHKGADGLDLIILEGCQEFDFTILTQ
jgi:hypothetical protein